MTPTQPSTRTTQPAGPDAPGNCRQTSRWQHRRRQQAAADFLARIRRGRPAAGRNRDLAGRAYQHYARTVRH